MYNFILPRVSGITSSDELRPMLNYVMIEDGVLWATNGHSACRLRLARLPGGEAADLALKAMDNKFFHWRDWKKVEGKHVWTASVEDKEIIFHVGARSPKPVSVPYERNIERKLEGTGPRYPMIESVFPESRELAASCPAVGFNPNILLPLYKALEDTISSDAYGLALNPHPVMEHGAILIQHTNAMDRKEFDENGHMIILMPAILKW